jgi:hypothetical protein
LFDEFIFSHEPVAPTAGLLWDDQDPRGKPAYADGGARRSVFVIGASARNATSPSAVRMAGHIDGIRFEGDHSLFRYRASP